MGCISLFTFHIVLLKVQAQKKSCPVLRLEPALLRRRRRSVVAALCAQEPAPRVAIIAAEVAARADVLHTAPLRIWPLVEVRYRLCLDRREGDACCKLVAAKRLDVLQHKVALT